MQHPQGAKGEAPHLTVGGCFETYALKMLIRRSGLKQFRACLQHQRVAFGGGIGHTVGRTKTLRQPLPSLSARIPLISIKSGHSKDLSTARAHHVSHQMIVSAWAYASIETRKMRFLCIREP